MTDLTTTLGRCGVNGRNEERKKCANGITNSRACCFGIGNNKGKNDQDPEKVPKPLCHRLVPRQVGASLPKSDCTRNAAVGKVVVGCG